MNDAVEQEVSESVDAPEIVTEQSDVAKLFEVVGISRVVHVDDAYSADADKIIELLAGLDPGKRAQLLNSSQDEMAVDGRWQEVTRTHWDGLDVAAKAELAEAVFAESGGSTPSPEGVFSSIEALVPDVEFLTLSLAEWKQRQDSIIGELTNKPTLILFDKDFSQESTEAGANGETLVAELEKAIAEGDGGDGVPVLFYGLLTHTVSIESEAEERQKMVDATQVDASRFVVIAKEHFSFDNDGEFAARIRTTLMAPVFAQLMQRVKAAISEHHEDAIKHALKLSPADLEYMVVRSSDNEGVWPPDTLVRVLEVLQRSKVRETLRSEEQTTGLTTVLNRLAAFADPEQDATSGPESIAIAHQEIYDSAEHVNSLCLPIEFGDMFVTDSGKRFILVAQPCDLMVRSDGKRAPEITHLLLAPVKSIEEEAKNRFSQFELPYFEKDTGASQYVVLDRPEVVRACVLDTCVFNPDGRGLLDPAADVPDELLPGWKLRRDRLLKKNAKAFGRIGTVTETATQHAILGQLTTDPIKIKSLDVANETIEWKFRRDMRLCEPYSRAVLSRFTQYLARDAFLHPLARTG
ncbi:MAG: hypothetical protein QM648_09395 [Solirubrobacterales bacterium]